MCTPAFQLLCAITLAGVGFGDTAGSESLLSLLHKAMATLRVVPATLVLGIQTETLHGHQVAVNLTDVCWSVRARAHLVIVRGIPQKPTEGDGVGDTAQVDEQNCRDGLDVEAVIEVTWEPGQLPLDVQA